jgi:hypothetical protein
MDVLKQRMIDFYGQPGTKSFRFAEERSYSLRPLEMNAENIYKTYVDALYKHVYLSPVVAKVRELMRYEWEEEATMPHGGKRKKTLKLSEVAPNFSIFLADWADRVAGKDRGVGSRFVDRLVQGLTRNVGMSMLTFNNRSTLIQPSAVVEAISDIGFKAMSEGTSLMAFSPEWRALAMRESRVLLGREYDIVADEIARSLVEHSLILSPMSRAKQLLALPLHVRDAVGRFGMKWLQFADMQSAMATWIGAVRKARRDGLTGRDAYNYADDVVLRTQGSSLPGHRAGIQSHVMGKALTALQTFGINQFNYLIRDIGQVGLKNKDAKKALARLTRWLVAAAIFNVIYEDIFNIPSPLPRPIVEFVRGTKKKDPIEGLKRASAELVQLVPIVGGAIRYGGEVGGPVYETISQSVKHLAGAKGPLKPKAEIVSRYAGIPGTRQISKSIKSFEEGGSLYDVILGLRPKYAPENPLYDGIGLE